MANFHLSRAKVTLSYSGGKISFESPQSLDLGEDPVKTKRLMISTQDFGYLEYKTGLSEPRMATLTAQNLAKDKLFAMIGLHENQEHFTLTVVDTKTGDAQTLSDAVFESRPEQQTIDTGDSFDYKLTIMYTKLEYLNA